MPLLCSAPYTGFFLRPDTFSCCCFLNFPLKRYPQSRAEMLDLVNHEALATIRKKLANNDYADLYCAKCPCLNSNELESDSGKYTKETFQRMQKAFFAQETRLDYIPPAMALLSQNKCNLHCKICGAGHSSHSDIIPKAIPDGAFERLFRDIKTDPIDEIDTCGGESLFTKDGRALLRFLTKQASPKTRVRLVTNGLLLHSMPELFDAATTLEINISVDGFKRSYEIIRRGARWQNIVRSLRFAQRAAQGKPNIIIKLNSLVCRSTIHDMPKLANFAKFLGFPINFKQMWGPFPDENLYEYPGLLTGLGWEAPFLQIKADKSLQGVVEMKSLDSLYAKIESLAAGLN